MAISKAGKGWDGLKSDEYRRSRSTHCGIIVRALIADALGQKGPLITFEIVPRNRLILKVA